MGKLIVIDGLDGSGKHTQLEYLYSYLEKKNVKVHKIAFPMYDSEGCIFVKKYLAGEFGSDPSDTSAYTSSLFFALDRYYSYKKEWKKLLEEENSVVIADRYTTANAVHQLSKLDKSEWDAFLEWLFDTEFSKLGLPSPDAVIYLELLPDIAIDLINKRSVADSRAKDIHEKDSGFLYRSYEAAMYASDKLSWKRIKCYENNEIRKREDIALEISEFVDSIL
jgi:dTMP kinase